MKTLVLSTLFGLGILSACGTAAHQESADLEVFGGSVVQQNFNDPRYFATVALTNDSSRAQGRSFCTGTLYTSRVVITAAHCVSDGRGGAPVPGRIMVTFGTYSNRQAPAVYVRRVLVHPQYNADLTTKSNPHTAPNDVALLFLERDAPAGFRAVPIFEETVENKQEIQIAGFGVTKSRNDGNTGTLRATRSSVRAFEGLQKRFSTQTLLSGACPGDSGGPAYVVRNGRWSLLGITSTGKEVFGSCFIGQNTFTDARYYFHWIRQNAAARIF